MASKILFVFEGENTEKQIAENLTKYFVNENINVQCAFCSDIYGLYDLLWQDEDLDTFNILKNRTQNLDILAPYRRNDFGEIYMFFDYDGHSTKASDQKINDLLLFFDNETETGKLFLSYPMIEAIKHLSPSIDFEKLKVKAKENIGYKGIVSAQCRKDLKNLTTLQKIHWLEILDAHLKKMNCIVNDSYTLPTNLISQLIIFLKQKEKYIDIDASVAVLSSFPIFMFDYYGVQKTTNFLEFGS